MKKRRNLLKAYEVAVRLYPKEFSKGYADEMLLTAEDALRAAGTRRAVAKIAGGLFMDLVVTIVQENSKHAGNAIIKRAKTLQQQSKRSLALLVLQSAGIGLITYISVAYALFNFNALRHTNGGSFWSDYGWAWSAELVSAAAPLLFVPVTFTVLRKTSSLSWWRKVTWAYGLGSLGMMGYLFVAFAANELSIHYLQQQHGYGWLIGLLCMGGYYFMLLKFQARIRAT